MAHNVRKSSHNIFLVVFFTLTFTLNISRATEYTASDYYTQDYVYDYDTSQYKPQNYDTPQYLTDSPPYSSEVLQNDCQCAMFLVTNSHWLPEHKVFSTGEHYNVNCSSPSQAREECKALCEEENSSVSRVFSLHPEALYQYPPSGNILCDVLPAATATFYQTCGAAWSPLQLPTYSHVCCHPQTLQPAWCDAIPDELFVQPELQTHDTGIEDRGLDLEKSPNDIENNEIEGSTKPEDDDFLSDDVEKQSWMKTALKFLGYDSLGSMVQNFDVFSLPARVRTAVREYRDEVNMGQCYMEFTTYSIFTKGENPFEAFIRTKRDLSDAPLEHHIGEVLANFEKAAEQGEFTDRKYSSGESKKAQIETINSLVGSLVNMLERTDGTKRYATVIKQLLPVVTRVYAAEDPQQAVHTFVSSVLGPYLEKLQNRKSKPGSKNKISEKMDKLKSKPSISDPPSFEKDSSSQSSPIANILLSLVRQYMGAYFNTLPGATNQSENSIEEVAKVPSTKRPTKRPASSPFNVMKLLNLFLGGGSQSRPRPRPSTTTTKAPKIEKNDIAESEFAPPKDFVDVVLEVIRPVFISILGKAPGDSGVSSIREMSRLSVLGRVDDTVAQKVLSPYFCLKTYGVNKAWSLTERTLRSFASSLTPDEIETFRALLD